MVPSFRPVRLASIDLRNELDPGDDDQRRSRRTGGPLLRRGLIRRASSGPPLRGPGAPNAGLRRPRSTGSDRTGATCDGLATLELVAINAVMAGCLPEHLAIVDAALRAALTPEHNL